MADSYKKILVLQPDHIGDVLLATPMIHALRQRFPQAQIDVVIGEWAKPVLESNPDINQVYVMNFRQFNRVHAKSSHQTKTFWKLRSNKYELAVMGRSRNRLIRLFAWAIGAKQRIGFRVPGKDLLLTIKVWQSRPREHVVIRNLRLAEHLGADIRRPELVWRITKAERQFASEQLKNWSQPIVGINPGAGTEAKRWPIARFAAVARRLQEKYRATIVITGCKAEDSLAHKISAALIKPGIDLAGKANLRQLAAVLAHLDLYVSNDSGPMHIAAAVGTPVIDLHSGTDYPSMWRPWGEQHTVLTHATECPKDPCYKTTCDFFEHGCLERITVADVLNAAGKYLKQKNFSAEKF